MYLVDRIPSAGLERRELQLILTASVAVAVLADGLHAKTMTSLRRLKEARR